MSDAQLALLAAEQNVSGAVKFKKPMFCIVEDYWNVFVST